MLGGSWLRGVGAFASLGFGAWTHSGLAASWWAGLLGVQGPLLWRHGWSPSLAKHAHERAQGPSRVRHSSSSAETGLPHWGAGLGLALGQGAGMGRGERGMASWDGLDVLRVDVQDELANVRGAI